MHTTLDTTSTTYTRQQSQTQAVYGKREQTKNEGKENKENKTPLRTIIASRSLLLVILMFYLLYIPWVYIFTPLYNTW